VQAKGNGLGDLGDVLESHPMFPYAWAHKLCYYANGRACAEGEELDRVVDEFVNSGSDFRVLIRELFSSPLVTGSVCTSGVNAGTTASIARRSTFCGQLSHRLQIDDLCAIRTLDPDTVKLQRDVRTAVASVPDDSFSRSEVAPVVISETSLFTRANREAACAILAQDGYDDSPVFAGAPPSEALDSMVAQVIGLPSSDPRHTAIRTILQDHFDEVVAAGKPQQDALESALALACMSPNLAGVGF
jgi:hypothetical protein